VFPNHGVLVSPLMVLRVEDKYGNVLSAEKPFKSWV